MTELSFEHRDNEEWELFLLREEEQHRKSGTLKSFHESLFVLLKNAIKENDSKEVQRLSFITDREQGFDHDLLNLFDGIIRNREYDRYPIAKLLIEIPMVAKLEEIRSFQTFLEAARKDESSRFLELFYNLPIDSHRLNQALHEAARHGNEPAVRSLLPKTDPKSNNSQAFCDAVEGKSLNIAKILLPLSDISQDNMVFLVCVATDNADPEMVSFLLDNITDKNKATEALRIALEEASKDPVDASRTQCAEILLQYGDFQTAKGEMDAQLRNTEFMAEITSKWEKAILSSGKHGNRKREAGL